MSPQTFRLLVEFSEGVVVAVSTRVAADVTTWAKTTARNRNAASARSRVRAGPLRFALYGRMSTTEYQDFATSWGWRRGLAEDLIAGYGVIVTEYFDVGVSRRVSVADHRMAIGWPMRVRTPTGRTRVGAGGRTGSHPIPRRRRTCARCSRSGWPGGARRASPGTSTTAACRAHPGWTITDPIDPQPPSSTPTLF